LITTTGYDNIIQPAVGNNQTSWSKIETVKHHESFFHCITHETIKEMH
jgi:hypothetical protein